MNRMTLDDIQAFLATNPGIERIELLFPDMNGVMRGKWYSPESADKLVAGKVRLPMSTYALDISGNDVDQTGLALASGDPDGYGWPVPGTLSVKPWSPSPAAQVLMTMTTPAGEPVVYDPRTRLAAAVERLAARGLTAVVATELEFYLYAPGEPGEAPVPPKGLEGAQVYDMSAVSSLSPCLEDIQHACAEQGIAADVLIAEFGPGQFEINFHHNTDALAMSDQSILFKRLVKGCARAHDLRASFMAKPYGGDHAGSGMHAHVSLIDAQGRNIFDAAAGGAAPEVADTLRHAVGGALATMRPLQAIFAPHANSYRRFQPGSYAPTVASWGLDHRGVAVRLPEISGSGARLEHRICGADVNPYLALAGILGGIAMGLEDGIEPPARTEADPVGERLHHDWFSAVEEFGGSEIARHIFGEKFHHAYTEIRLSEIAMLAAQVSDVEYRTYLHKL